MASKADWLKLAKDLSKGSAKKVVKSLVWVVAGIFCTQKALDSAYEGGSLDALSKVSETVADGQDENDTND